jgi:hypothetical protein
VKYVKSGVVGMVAERGEPVHKRNNINAEGRKEVDR